MPLVVRLVCVLTGVRRTRTSLYESSRYDTDSREAGPAGPDEKLKKTSLFRACGQIKQSSIFVEADSKFMVKNLRTPGRVA
jgi:hypothetical protein